MVMQRREFVKALPLGVMGAALYSFFEPNIFLENVEVDLDLGAGMKILFISDTHFHGVEAREKPILKAVEDLIPSVDAVFVAGDMYDEYSFDLTFFRRFLDILGEKGYVVYGNHEHWAGGIYPLDEVSRIIEASGVTLLRNEAVWVDTIKVGGIDWYNEDPSLGMSYVESLGSIDILISHTPDILRDAPGRYRVVLAGHTHGGQVLRGFGVVSASRYGYQYGYYEVEGRRMFVSKGAGEIIPFRLFTPREIILVNV